MEQARVLHNTNKAATDKKQKQIVLERPARLKLESTPTDWVDEVDGDDQVDEVDEVDEVDGGDWVNR